MRPPDAVTQTLTIADVRSGLDTLVVRVARGETRVVVEQRGVPVAALVSTEDLERLDRLDRERAGRFAVVDEVRAAFAGVPDDEIERETERILAEHREKSHQGTGPASQLGRRSSSIPFR